MKYKLKKTEEEVLESIKHTVTHARNLCDNIEWSCEDGGRSNLEFLYKCIELAISSGASTINIPDTVGFTFLLNLVQFLNLLKIMFQILIKHFINPYT